MKRLSRCVVSQRTCLPAATVCEPSRWQTTSSSSSATNNAEDGISTVFPGDAVKEASRPAARRSRDSSRHTDSLLKEIFSLEKQVVAEQQRQRLSVRASQLGETAQGAASTSTRRDGRRKRLFYASPPAEELAGEGVGTSELQSPAAAVVTAPPLSTPTPEQAAAAARQARRVDREVAGTEAAPTLPATAASFDPLSAPPRLQSWTSSFDLTAAHLQTSLEGPASEVAFTLEELEDTLFSPAAEPEKAGQDTASSATAPPPPPPPPPQRMPTDAPPVVDAERAEQMHDSAAATSASAPEAEVLSDTPVCVAPQHQPPPPLPTSSWKEDSEGTASPVAPTSATAEDLRSAPPPPLPLPPVLRCRLRKTAVVVSMTRPASTTLELVEALQEAVTFAESLPSVPQGTREVRLRVDVGQADCADYAFLSTKTAGSAEESVDEHVATQAAKERLLRRLYEGPQHGSHYVAEVQAKEAVSTPVVLLRDFSAELLLACAAHEVRLVARPSLRLDGEGKNAVQLSFSGISAGVFPAAATIRHVHQLLRVVNVGAGENNAEQRRQLTRLMKPDEDLSAAPLADDVDELTTDVLLSVHLLPAEVSTLLLRHATDVASPSTELAQASIMGRVGEWVRLLTVSLTQWWSVARQQRAALLSASLDSSSYATALQRSSLSACVTTPQVWSWWCRRVLSTETPEDASTTRSAFVSVFDAAPLRRWRRSCASVHPPQTSRSVQDLRSHAAPLPYVMEVTGSTLAQTSTADLASEVREQPADVVLALSATTIALEQRLKFLASLHLTDTGAHHRVTVLLAGTPQEVDECVTLTKSSARLAVPPNAAYGPVNNDDSSAAGPSLHHVVEVAPARWSCASATSEMESDEVAAAVHYVTNFWHRPCVATASGGVGLALFTAARDAEKRLAKRRSSGATLSTGATQWDAALYPLRVLPVRAADVICAAHETASTAPVALGDATAQECGLAFLMVLDAACQVLRRESPSTTVAAVNVLSIAALQLDASAGGVFDAADRICDGDVQRLVTVMEFAASADIDGHPAPSFASLPLLHWMADERLLFYQLNSSSLERFANSSFAA